jgi:hypothetical protein
MRNSAIGESMRTSAMGSLQSQHRTSEHSIESKPILKRKSLDGLLMPDRPSLDILAETSNAASYAQTAPVDVKENPLERSILNQRSPNTKVDPNSSSVTFNAPNIQFSSPMQTRRKSMFPGTAPKNEEASDKKQVLQERLMKKLAQKYGDMALVESTSLESAQLQKKSSSLSITSHSHRNWMKVIHSLYYGCLIRKTYKHLARRLAADTQDAHQIENRSLAYVLKTLGSQPPAEFIQKVKYILMEHPSNRSQEQLMVLERMLSSRLQDFAKLGMNERLHLCKIMQLDFYPKGTILLWEEHKVTCFYYILSGQIEVFKLNNGGKILLSMMNPGTVFGHARVKVEKATRSACAAMSMDTHVLYIEKESYLKVSFIHVV